MLGVTEPGGEGVLVRAGWSWVALTAVALLAAACSDCAAPTTTVPSADLSDLEQQVADQSARIREFEANTSELTEQLTGVLSDLARVLAQRDSLAYRLADSEQRQAGINDWVQEEFNRYQADLERLRGQVPLPDSPEARRSLQTLEAFLTAMRDGEYATAADLCCGSYEALVDWNPGIDPADEPALLQSACENQLRCDLTVRRILAGSVEPDRYEFYVEFQTSDGRLFSLGPCCGSNTDPTVSQFRFTVTLTPEGPQVLDPQNLYMG